MTATECPPNSQTTILPVGESRRTAPRRRLTKPVQMLLPDELLRRIDEATAHRGYESRSAFVRSACNAYLAENSHD